ncbi:PE family protein, partial [Mycobacterium angelicum]
MSVVFATPELVGAAATDLANIGSTISAANASAALPTTEILAAGADEISAGIAALFGAHALAYQRLSAQAVLFHSQFVQALNAAAGAYAGAEAAAAAGLQGPIEDLLYLINLPTQLLLGRPLIGNGTDGAAGTGADGGAGGLLFGDGGSGGSGGGSHPAGGRGGA